MYWYTYVCLQSNDAVRPQQLAETTSSHTDSPFGKQPSSSTNALCKISFFVQYGSFKTLHAHPLKF